MKFSRQGTPESKVTVPDDLNVVAIISQVQGNQFADIGVIFNDQDVSRGDNLHKIITKYGIDNLTGQIAKIGGEPAPPYRV
jgi:hypothetical protein